MYRFIPFFFLLFNCITISQVLVIPKNYDLQDSVSADLDKDGIKELVVVYNTKTIDIYNDTTTNINIPREIYIYKLINTEWILWKFSKYSLRNCYGSPLIGPYVSLKIEKGILKVLQEGTLGTKWRCEDSYKYLDSGFYLVHYFFESGKYLAFWTTVRYNLLTGKCNYKFEVWKNNLSDDFKDWKNQKENFYKKGLRITLENRHEDDLIIITPKFKNEIYLSEKMN